ncbi:MAG: hypothetical protein ACE5H4_00520 [Candidatus Thorarchaeota archaeon]
MVRFYHHGLAYVVFQYAFVYLFWSILFTTIIPNYSIHPDRVIIGIVAHIPIVLVFGAANSSISRALWKTPFSKNPLRLGFQGLVLYGIFMIEDQISNPAFIWLGGPSIPMISSALFWLFNIGPRVLLLAPIYGYFGKLLLLEMPEGM